MAYTPLDISKPDQATQNITQAFATIRANDEALLDQICTLGIMPGWKYSVPGADYAKPAEIRFTHPTDANRIIKVIYTYDGSDRVQTMKVAKTTNGSTWEKVAYGGSYDLCTFTYDGTTGALASTLWSASA